MKFLTVITTACCASLLVSDVAYGEVFFQNEVIPQIDCVPVFGGRVKIGIEGKTVHDILWLMNQMKEIQQGLRKKGSNEVTKKFTYQNKQCSLQDLVEYEAAMFKEFSQIAQLRHDQEKRVEYEQRLQDYEYRTILLKAALDRAKNDFIEKSVFFMPQVRLMKTLLMELMNEWAQRCHRPDSFLLTWANVGKNEDESIREKMVTCKDFDQFLTDLQDFLTKLVQSCPRALTDYKEHKDEYHKK